MKTLFSILLACIPHLAMAAQPLLDLSAEEYRERAAFAACEDILPIREQAGLMAQELGQLERNWAASVDDFMANIAASSGEQALPPEPPPSGNTVIDSSLGMYMDAQESSLCYFGKVRLRDPRMKLDCSRLYLQLQKQKVELERQETVDEVKETQSPPLNSPATPKKEVVNAPLTIKAEQVLINMEKKQVYARGSRITLEQEGGCLEVEGGEPFLLISDVDGVIYVHGASIRGHALDSSGRSNRFECEGSALFTVERDSLILERKAQLQRDQTQVISQGSLRVALRAKPEQGSASDLRLSRAYESIERITASQGAKVSGKDSKGVAYTLSGDTLSYNGDDGEIIVTGPLSQFNYGSEHITLQQDTLARLYPDGSIKLQAHQIEGQYERQAQQDAQLLQGQFVTQKELFLPAGDHCAYFPYGLKVNDAELDFSSTGPVRVHFTQDETVAQDASSVTGDASAIKIPQFPQLGDIELVEAEGEIVAHRLLPDSPATLKGNQLQANLIAGSAVIEASAGQKVVMSLQDKYFESSSASKASSIALLRSGNIDIQGDVINARMMQGGQPATLQAADCIYLNREAGVVEVQRDAVIQTSSLNFSAQEGFNLYLHRNEQKATTAISPRYPHLIYPFDGIERAVARGGSSMQSAQLSLQCDGELQIDLEADAFTPNRNSKRDQTSLNGLKQAQAFDHVRIVAKDSESKLYRASGDYLKIDGKSGVKSLYGNPVILVTEDLIHEASGKGAEVRIDAKNSVSIKGEKQKSYAENIRQRMGETKEKKFPTKNKP